MSRHPKAVVEYRSYELPAHFPIRFVGGDDWHISNIPSDILHFHNCLELGYCETESGIMRFQDMKCPFSAGDVTIISGDVLHTTYSSPGQSSKWSYLFVDAAELLRPFFPLDSLPNNRLFKDLLYGYYNVISPTVCPAAAPLMQLMFRELTEKQLNYEISIRGLFLSLMTELMRVRSQLSDPQVHSTMPIAPALQYINAHYTENFPISDLAGQCSMSESHFRRVFHDFMGVGPLEHINHTRILKACSLLRMTESSVLSISELVGFRSLSSFNRHFLEAMGVSPNEWRRRISDNKRASILKYSGWLTPPKEPEGDPTALKH